MALLDILHYPDPRLRTVARPVAAVDERVRRLVSDMLETMYAVKAIGLAATQVDVHERVVVIDVSRTRDDARVLVNPQLLHRSEEMCLGEERCLSVPGEAGQVARHARVTVRALGLDGQPREFEAEGRLAVAVQHEMDHLVGRVFVDALSALKRDRVRRRMLKRARGAGQG